MRPNKLDQIKKEQMAQAEKQGITYQELVGNKNTGTSNRLENIKHGDKAQGEGHAMFHQLKAAMEVDLQRIKGEGNLEAKTALKRDLLPNYMPFITEYMDQGHDYPNMLAVQMMIWLFDLGEIEQALQLGLYLLGTPKQDMPPAFNRDIATFMADSIYDWANVELKAERSASPYLDTWVEFVLGAEFTLAPMVESKGIAMLAKHEMAKGNLEHVVRWCELAEKVNPEGHGTKTMKEKATKQLANAAAAAADNETNLDDNNDQESDDDQGDDAEK